MSIPTQQDIATMTATAESLMLETCTITDPGTPQPTPSGGTIPGTPTAYNNVPCRRVKANVQSVRGVFSEQQIVVADYLLAVEKDQPIAVGWKVSSDGVDYAVTALAKPGTIATIQQALIKSTAVVGE